MRRLCSSSLVAWDDDFPACGQCVLQGIVESGFPARLCRTMSSIYEHFGRPTRRPFTHSSNAPSLFEDGWLRMLPTSSGDPQPQEPTRSEKSVAEAAAHSRRKSRAETRRTFSPALFPRVCTRPRMIDVCTTSWLLRLLCVCPLHGDSLPCAYIPHCQLVPD